MEDIIFGRYEASDANATEERTNSSVSTNEMACRKDGYVYNYLTQLEAASLCRNMYSSNSYTSDLINSYAWDTSIIFIQTFGKSNYSRQKSLKGNKMKTGLSGDEQLHINDMASNVHEWTTGTGGNSKYPCVERGGFYGSSSYYTSVYGGTSTIYRDVGNGFRPLLYL